MNISTPRQLLCPVHAERVSDTAGLATPVNLECVTLDEEAMAGFEDSNTNFSERDFESHQPLHSEGADVNAAGMVRGDMSLHLSLIHI